MFNKIRSTILKRKWFALHKQIVFLKRELRKLNAELTAEIKVMADRKARGKEPSKIHITFHQIEKLTPLKNKIENIESVVNGLDIQKRAVRLKIEGLSPIGAVSYGYFTETA